MRIILGFVLGVVVSAIVKQRLRRRRGLRRPYDWRGCEVKARGRDEWIDIEAAAKAGYVRTKGAPGNVDDGGGS